MAEDTQLRYYQAEAYTRIVADLIKEYEPEIFLLGSTDTDRDLAPRVAARGGIGLTAHCVDLRVEDRDGIPLLCQTVPGWGDNRINIFCPGKQSQMVTVRPGTFDVPPQQNAKQAEVVRVTPRVVVRDFRAETVEVVELPAPVRPLEDSDIVIAAGWGMYSIGSMKPVEDLADSLGGDIGGTRPIVDKGWLPADRMIGQSGKTISPKLLISLGASGAMHFTSGFERAKFIVAADQNPDAPIFRVADIGIVGDLREVLPRLIREFRELNQTG